MALADIPTSEHSRRLDSWKEIAEYLRRDVRTAARWESQGLPLHRVAGGKGRSVFAFTDEIDTWMAGQSAETVAAADGPMAADGVPVAEPTTSLIPVPVGRRFKPLIIGAACGLTVIVIGAVAMLRGEVAPLDLSTARVTATDAEVSIADGSGASRVVYHFDPAARPTLLLRPPALVADLDADGSPEILVGTSFYEVARDRAIRGGELLSLATSGGIRWRFAFNDALAFTGQVFSGPWALADWQVEPAASPARIAVSAHDYTWWASIVTVLDHHGRRSGTFVNPGWVESVLWLDRGRLAIGGFNNSRDEAMLAVLDSTHMDGQAPGSDGTAFACLTCPSSPPLLYATFARSELNRLTAGRFNRASVSVVGDRILVTTVETDRERGEANAMYEFDRNLRFVRARYSERYWDEHRRLELEGRLTHSRAACPERDGPPAIHVWDAARGWMKTTPVSGG